MNEEVIINEEKLESDMNIVSEPQQRMITVDAGQSTKNREKVTRVHDKKG